MSWPYCWLSEESEISWEFTALWIAPPPSALVYIHMNFKLCFSLWRGYDWSGAGLLHRFSTSESSKSLRTTYIFEVKLAPSPAPSFSACCSILSWMQAIFLLMTNSNSFWCECCASGCSSSSTWLAKNSLYSSFSTSSSSSIYFLKYLV